jgi:hypothetical protein
MKEDEISSDEDEFSASDSDADEEVIPARIQARSTSPKDPITPDRFDRKLYAMVSDPELEKFICWTDDGKSIVILDTKEFEREVLKTTQIAT